MNTLSAPHRSYAKVIEVSKRVRWEIDRDVIRQRQFDYTRTFLPDGLSLAGELAFLNAADQRLLSQVQGRTYAYIFGLVERFIAAKVMDLSREHQFWRPGHAGGAGAHDGRRDQAPGAVPSLESMIAADMPRAMCRPQMPMRSPRPCSRRRRGRCWH